MSADIDPACLALLSDPKTYHADTVEQIETHAARVFLAGDRAFKIKKPVSLGYLDFTNVEAREAALRAELTLNTPNAPQIYRQLTWITREADGALALAGAGAPFEPVLEMSRFDTNQLLDVIAGAGALEPSLARDLALAVRASHERATGHQCVDGAARILRVLNAACDRLELDGAPEGRIEAIRGRIGATLNAQSRLLDARGRAGFVRRCHGDLHLGNIVRLDGKPVLFDALEFDETLATIDVLYDLAFLIMDLVHHDQRGAAAVLLSHYFAEESDSEVAGVGLLAPFCALRALIRALVALDRGRPGDERHAEAHLALAEAFAEPPAPRLIAVGGLSGTGKTTLALGLAAQLGGPAGLWVIRADLERKALFGVAWNQPLPSSAYTADASARVYARMRAKAEAGLAGGVSVVLDAVHARPEERRAAQDLAQRLAVPFDGVWLDADPELLTARVSARTGDASDADARVVALQTEYELGPISWSIVHAGCGAQTTLAGALEALGHAVTVKP